jgi:uncharacterized protein
MEWIIVSLASMLAGFVDAIVGGGGLILLPALFATFPTAPPATLLGTNKSASVWGTAMSTWQYGHKVQLPWRAMMPAACVGMAGSFAGAWAVTQISPDFLRQLLPLVLLGVLVYTLVRKDMGRNHTPLYSGRAETLIACAIGLAIGFYDGFFGPGTGSFFVFLFVRLMGYDFLNASASAVHAQGPYLVAPGRPHGGGQCAGRHAGHTHGPAPWNGLRAGHLHRRGEPVDPQDRLRRLHRLSTQASGIRNTCHRHRRRQPSIIADFSP